MALLGRVWSEDWLRAVLNVMGGGIWQCRGVAWAVAWEVVGDSGWIDLGTLSEYSVRWVLGALGNLVRSVSGVLGVWCVGLYWWVAYIRQVVPSVSSGRAWRIGSCLVRLGLRCAHDVMVRTGKREWCV